MGAAAASAQPDACCATSASLQHSLPLPAPQVLWKTYGRDLMIAGVFKLLWSVFVILGGERQGHGRLATACQCSRRLASEQQAAASTLPLHAPAPSPDACAQQHNQPSSPPSPRSPPRSLLLHPLHPAVHPHTGGQGHLPLRHRVEGLGPHRLLLPERLAAGWVAGGGRGLVCARWRLAEQAVWQLPRRYAALPGNAPTCAPPGLPTSACALPCPPPHQ